MPGPLYEPTSADSDAARTCRDKGFHGVHAKGKKTVTAWAPFAGDPNVKFASDFGDGSDDSTLLFDEMVAFDEKRVGVRYALVVERVDKDGAGAAAAAAAVAPQI